MMGATLTHVLRGGLPEDSDSWALCEEGTSRSDTEALGMIVQLEAVEYRGLEAGMSLVVFEEKTAIATGVAVCWRGAVGDWKRRPSGEQTGIRWLYRPAFGMERESIGVCSIGVCTLSHHLWWLLKTVIFPMPKAERKKWVEGLWGETQLQGIRNSIVDHSCALN